MEIRRYLSIIRRRLFLVLAIIVAAVVAGWLVTPRNDTYTATTTLYVGSHSIDLNPQSGVISGDYVSGLNRLITTFAEMASTRPIAVGALQRTHANRLPGGVAGRTKAQQVTNTNLIDVSYTDADPAVAQQLANAIASSLVDQVRTFEAPTNSAAGTNVLSVYDRAQRPTVANPSSLKRNLTLALLFGVVVAAALVALLEYLDITLRSADDAERELELPVLGVIPSFGGRMPITPAVQIRVPTPTPPADRPGAPVG
jgi:capsular polysaccharide biosynthesis protein